MASADGANGLIERATFGEIYPRPRRISSSMWTSHHHPVWRCAAQIKFQIGGPFECPCQFRLAFKLNITLSGFGSSARRMALRFRRSRTLQRHGDGGELVEMPSIFKETWPPRAARPKDSADGIADSDPGPSSGKQNLPKRKNRLHHPIRPIQAFKLNRSFAILLK
jgi:hypothetical protein